MPVRGLEYGVMLVPFPRTLSTSACVSSEQGCETGAVTGPVGAVAACSGAPGVGLGLLELKMELELDLEQPAVARTRAHKMIAAKKMSCRCDIRTSADDDGAGIIELDALASFTC